MGLKNTLKIAEDTNAFKQKLLRKEHAAYCLAMHEIIQNQQLVLYNAIGPDISTILLTTNPNKIIGIDKQKIDMELLSRYIDTCWEQVDTNPIITPSAIWYEYPENNLDNYIPDNDRKKRFEEQLRLRTKRGYWDESYLMQWGIERLICFEMKKMGVDKEEIIIDEVNSKIIFQWAFPNEKKKERIIQYIKGPIDKITKQISLNIDCFYQKSLPQPETEKYLSLILPHMNNKAICMIGHKFYEHLQNKNNIYKKEISKTLGDKFKNIPTKEIDSIVDEITDGDDWESVYDRKDGTYDYGIKLNVFKREPNYKIFK